VEAFDVPKKIPETSRAPTTLEMFWTLDLDSKEMGSKAPNM
jgi:hypothetical protein